jgi:hypothetical protein
MGMKTKERVEFGDFQTPLALAQLVCGVLARRRVRPRTIIEPTCGRGAFLQAALQTFSTATRAVGLEINPSYADSATALLRKQPYGEKAEVIQSDFFATNWPKLIEGLDEPILVIGNPPWVTNAELGTLGSANLPEKSNFQKRDGFDAISGKANFDISEWMLIKLLEWLDGREATLAMLCKTAVARRVLLHAWESGISLKGSSIHPIDAGEYFGASVDACLLVCDLSPACHYCDCEVYERLGDAKRAGVVGYRDGHLLADVAAYERWKHLQGQEVYRWRSGVKHDCGKVMELRAEGNRYRNGLDEVVELEPDYLYPMLKSSDVADAARGTSSCRRYMLITQKTVGEDTAIIRLTAPKTWRYLLAHAEILDRRASSIYRKRPRFSVFGVGRYTFAPWKVAISGFYKRLGFSVVGLFKAKPIVLDDTSYFLPCQSKEEAEFLAALLSSEPAKEFLSAFIFWDAKRPITVDVLKQLNLVALAKELHVEDTLTELIGVQASPRAHKPQRMLFDDV